MSNHTKVIPKSQETKDLIVALEEIQEALPLVKDCIPIFDRDFLKWIEQLEENLVGFISILQDSPSFNEETYESIVEVITHSTMLIDASKSQEVQSLITTYQETVSRIHQEDVASDLLQAHTDLYLAFCSKLGLEAKLPETKANVAKHIK